MDIRIKATLTKKWYGALDLSDMTANVYYWEGDEEIMESVPFMFEVCSTCKGTGFYTNPNIDSNGITEDEFNEEWSFEEQQDYINGKYDMPCATCDGQCVIPVVDPNRGTQSQIDLVEKVNQMHTDYAAERYNELKYGY
jgi:hypothetical protein